MASAPLVQDNDSDYRPTDDEPYMSDRQLAYFRDRLEGWRDTLHKDARRTLDELQDHRISDPDPNDRASAETDWTHELRTRDRQRKLIVKIEAALRRIDEGEYGYCDVTGEPIGLPRLEARPIATMTIEAQEAYERRERLTRDF